MGQFTVVLAGMVLLLLIANAILAYIKSQRKKAASHVNNWQAIGIEKGVYPEKGRVGEAFAFSEQAFKQVTPLEKKVELAHARLQALESKMKAMQGIYEENLKAKVDKLEGFRATANAELIALKEMVGVLQKNGKANGNGHKRKAAVAEEDISTEELRKLIYRSQN